ncbi:MAG: ABC transporter permease [Mucinivorans sp.]
MIRFLIQKEFLLIMRNKFLPRLIVIMPLIMMTLLPFAANLEVSNINISVVDSDHSQISSQLINKISASQYFNMISYPPSYEQAMQAIERGDVDVVLEIPNDFARNVATARPVDLHISANAVNATKAAMGSNYLNSIVQTYAKELSESQGSNVRQKDARQPALTVTSQYRFNPYLNYKFFMVPALMVMLLTIICAFLPAVNIVGEKETGTIEQMNVTPVGKFAFIFSKIIPYWIIGFVVLTICFGVAYVLYDLIPNGSLLTIYVGALFFILIVSGTGLLISNYSSTLQQAMFVMFFFMIILILLSGLFTPVESMPHWAQNITIFNPLKYFIEIMRGVYLKSSTLSDIASQIGVLSIFAVVINGWAIISYHKKNQ